MPFDQNPLRTGSPAASHPARIAFEITPSDSVEIPTGTRGIYVGVAGDLTVIMLDEPGSKTVKFTGLAAGVVHPIAAKQVMSTGTTVDEILGLL